MSDCVSSLSLLAFYVFKNRLFPKFFFFGNDRLLLLYNDPKCQPNKDLRFEKFLSWIDENKTHVK